MLPKVFALGIAAFGLAMMMSPVYADHGRGYDDQQDERYNDQNDGRSDSVECTSQGYRFTRCDVDWRDADLVRQTSDAQCVEGRTWGTDRRGLWVDRGCGGVFVESGRGGHHGGGQGGWHPGNNWDQDIRFRCESDDYRYRLCQVDTGRGGAVRIDRQISDTACIQGRNWGYNRAGVWVSGGCAAIFRVERRWR